MISISSIYIYPIKSLAGMSVLSAKVTDRGLEFDRRWMLIDENNRFLSQRELPEMAMLQTEIVNDELKVFHRNDPSLKVQFPLVSNGIKIINTIIWDDQCAAIQVSEDCDKWFSEILKKKCRLVYMNDHAKRWVNPKYAENKLNNFSDEFPISIISNQSLELLNSKLTAPIQMDRFRPNIVIDAEYPHQEDELKKFKINNLIFKTAKSIARCIITTIDQTTSLKGKEPLYTLSTYRSQNNKIHFGKSAIAATGGIIHFGDNVLK